MLNFIKKLFTRNKKTSKNDKQLTLSLAELVKLEKAITTEIKNQNDLFQAQTDAEVDVIQWTLSTLDRMQKDLAKIKELRLNTNAQIGNNKLIMELEVYKTKLNNLVKYRKSIKNEEIKFFTLKLRDLKYDSVVGKLKSKIRKITEALEKNNTTSKIEVDLDYKFYNFKPELA